MRLYAVFIVKHVHGSFPPTKILKDLKDWRLKEIGRKKKADATDADLEKDCRIARNAECPLALLNEE